MIKKVACIGGWGHWGEVVNALENYDGAKLCGVAPAYDGEDLAGICGHPPMKNVPKFGTADELLDSVDADIAIVSSRPLFSSYMVLKRLLLAVSVSFYVIGQAQVLQSDWIDPARIMVIYNTVKMASVDPAEPATFSHDMGEWYMQAYGMPTNHLFGYNMGTQVKWWSNHGAYDFLQAVADYIELHDIQIVLLAPGTPMIVPDVNNKANLALDSLVGHALWFAHVKQEAPACDNPNSISPTTCNLYFPYVDMGDGASPFVMSTSDPSYWCPEGGDLGGGSWLDTMMKDLRNHPSVRPFGRIGLPYYLEEFPRNDTNGVPIPELQIPLENSQFVKDLVNGGLAASTSIDAFNSQTNRCLLFFGRPDNTASYIDVESGINEAMAQDAIMQGVSSSRITRILPRLGMTWTGCFPEPVWDFTFGPFTYGNISPGINPLIFSAGGVNNTTENQAPWPRSLNVQPGMVASDPVSQGKDFSGSLLKRGATTMVVNIHHPQNSRLHAWFSVFRQLVNGATVAEAMVAGGGSERGGYITGSIWGDPLYAPFGQNTNKEDWFIGGSRAPATPVNFAYTKTSAQTNLSWFPTHLAAGYRIERRTETNGFEQIADLEVPTKTYTDTAVSPDSGYEYRICAYNTAGDSDWSELLAFTPLPAVTTILTTDDAGSADASVQSDLPNENFGSQTNLFITGTFATDSVRKTYLRFDLNGLPDLITAKLNLTVVDTRDFGFSLYFQNVVLLDESSDAWSENTITWSNAPQNDVTTTGFTAPVNVLGTTAYYTPNLPAPGNLLTTSINVSTLNASRGANGLVSFGIYDAGANPGTADFASREHATYQPPTLEVTHDPLQPRRPLFFTASPGATTTTNIVLEWIDNSGDETGFEIERRALGGASFASVQTLGIDATAFTNAVPFPGVVYEYRVRATGLTNNSSWSLIATATAPGTATPYQLWLQSVGLPMDGSGDGDPLAAPVADNIANLTKYGLGLNSIHIGSGGRIMRGIIDDSGSKHFALIYVRPEPPPDGLLYTIAASSDLSLWSSVGIVESGAESNGLRTVTARDPIPMTNAAKRFLRLRISQP